jgi:uncharacterized protein YjbI with pentapeptide repeats
MVCSQSQADATTHSLAGKTVAFVGKFGYQDLWLKILQTWAANRGGIVVDADQKPQYLVWGEGRGGRPPGDVARIQKRHPAVTALDQAAFLQLVLPSGDELLEAFRAGSYKDWDNLDSALRLCKTPLDLNDRDFRGLNLKSAKLECAALDGADLRCAQLQFAHLPALTGAKCDDAVAHNIHLMNLTDCSFRRAALEKAWLFWGQSNAIVRCDFRDAKLPAARMEGGKCSECNFTAADLSDAELERTTFTDCTFANCDLSRIHAPRTKFERADFQNAKLERADLRNASLVNADLRNANLRDAVLSDADLTGANVDGADFAGAVLTGAMISGIDFSIAKNFVAATMRKAGPKLLKLAAAASDSPGFMTTAEVELGPDDFSTLQIKGCAPHIHATSQNQCRVHFVFDQIPAPTFENGMLNLADRWPNSTLRLDSITVKGSRNVRGKKLQELARAAWAEVFGVTLDPAALKQQEEQQRQEALDRREGMVADLRIKGSEAWNSLAHRDQERIDLRGVDLHGARLPRLSMWGRVLQGTNFSGAVLTGAELWHCKLLKADLSGANLSDADLSHAILEKANLKGANLKGAKLDNAKLQGADFTDANLEDASLGGAQFDEATQFPAGFALPEGMAWKGDGPRPGLKAIQASRAGSLDFETFLKQLNDKVERSRMEKAGSMLKAERFRLFSEVKDDSIVGVVKSQSNAELAYSCRLASDGSFGCCTQNLRYCGGLRGALCKHLLVLIVGLARAGEIDAATVDHWINLSRGHKPSIDEDLMTDTFLRYKGAEAGEIDWRPTETIPEDFYAM